MIPMILFVVTLVGCQTLPQPAPGLAALRVTVTADPTKAAAAARPSVYDTSVDVDYTAMGNVDFSKLHDIVIWIEDGSGKSPASYQPAPLKVDLNGLGGTPALAGAVSVGQTIIFHNAGLSPLNVYSMSDANMFNVGSIASFQDGSYVVKSAGLIEVRSDAASAPLTRIYAAPVGPVYVAQPGGVVDFNNLTPGHYTVVAWHRQVPGSIVEADVTADHLTSATINVGANLTSKAEAK